MPGKSKVRYPLAVERLGMAYLLDDFLPKIEGLSVVFS